MKRTLLSMVQSILNDMSGDEVNSIADTFESEAIATTIRDVFFTMIDTRNWEHLKQFIQIDTSTTTTQPTHFYLPEVVKEVIEFRYDNRTIGESRRKFKKVDYIYPDDFLRRSNARNNDKDNVDLVEDPSGAELLILNDTPPQFWTSFNDRTIVFDSYDSGVDSTIRASKIQAHCWVTPTWEVDDDFIPFLPEESFSELLNSAKAACFENYKEVQNVTAERDAKRTRTWNARKNFTANGGVRYPSYGRTKPGHHTAVRPHPLDKDN